MGAKREAKKEFAKEQELAKLRAKKARADRAKADAKRASDQRVAAAAAARQRRLSAMTPAQRRSHDKRQTVLGFLVLAVIVLFIGGCIVSVATSSNDDREPSTSSDGDDDALSDSDDGPDEADAGLGFEMCKDFVKGRLKAPSTASFRNFYEDDGEVSASVDGDEVTIISTVDSENGFGADIRTAFSCTVRDDGDTWQLIDLQIDG